MDIVFGCDKADNEFPVLINKEFTNIEEFENYSFSGMEEMLVFVVPLVAFSVQLIDFIMTHVKKEKCRGRVVIIKGKKYSFDGYTKNEIIDILKELE